MQRLEHRGLCFGACTQGWIRWSMAEYYTITHSCHSFKRTSGRCWNNGAGVLNTFHKRANRFISQNPIFMSLCVCAYMRVCMREMECEKTCLFPAEKGRYFRYLSVILSIFLLRVVDHHSKVSENHTQINYHVSCKRLLPNWKLRSKWLPQLWRQYHGN